MQKLNMKVPQSITFEEGCEKYLEYCRQRNLRDGTIGHYRHSYVQFYKFFDPNMPIENFTPKMYKDYVLHLKRNLDNDISINSYLRDLITTLHFFMDEGYIPHFKMQAIKTDKSHIETYSESELQLLLKKPDIKRCKFVEYQCWVMTNFLFSTGVRQRSLMHIKVKDVDFDNNVVYVNVTKNRKPLIVPLNHTMVNEIVECCSINSRGLPLGFITSPILSNIYLKEFDCILYGYLKNMHLDNVVYTRYADDMIISFKSNSVIMLPEIELSIINLIKSNLTRYGLRINDKKTRSYNLNISNHVRITGINITKLENGYRHLSVGRTLKNELFWDAVKCFETKQEDEIQRIKGLQAFVLSVEKTGYEFCYSKGMMQLLNEMGFESLKNLIDSL